MAQYMFLVRGGDGKMRTIMASSARAAARKYVDKYDVDDGEEIDVKERDGKPCWERFKVG